jgi:tetratricopeptide (TPR) repeat protein
LDFDFAANQSGKPEAALLTAETALKNTPKSPTLLSAQRNALFLLDRIPAAIQSYSLALQQKPDLARARFNLARCQLQAGQITDATNSLLETLRTAPEMTAARLLMAELLLKQKHVSEASKQLQILSTQLPDSHPQLKALLKQLNAPQTTD